MQLQYLSCNFWLFSDLRPVHTAQTNASKLQQTSLLLEFVGVCLCGVNWPLASYYVPFIFTPGMLADVLLRSTVAQGIRFFFFSEKVYVEVIKCSLSQYLLLL